MYRTLGWSKHIADLDKTKFLFSFLLGRRILEIHPRGVINQCSSPHHVQSQSDIQINPRAEPQIEREMDSEKKADAYDPVVRTESDDVEQGKVRPFLGAQHQDIIPDSIGPNFIRAEHVRRGLSQRHIQVSLRLNG